MKKYVWSADKKTNRWPEDVEKYLHEDTPQPITLNSADKITLICDIHGEYKKTIERLYLNLNEKGYPVCPKCSRIEATKKAQQTNLKKYGTKAPAQNKSVLEKMKKTNLEKYGVEFHVQAPDFEEKMKKTNLEKYGEEYAILNKDVRAKADETMMERYGTIHALQNEESFKKFADTMNERYGADFSLQSEELRGKFTESMLERYGVEHALQHGEFIQKQKETNMNLYGTEYASQNEDIKRKMKETFIENFGVDNPMKSEKGLKHYTDTMNLKYGKDYPFQAYEVYLKSCESLKYEPVTKEVFEIFNDRDLFSKYLDELTVKLGRKPSIFDISDSTGYARTGISNRIIKFNLEDKIQYLAGESQYEYQIIDFLKEFNIKYKHRYTKLGPELDIYLPDYNIGIEFNGLYWHSDLFKNKKYHYKKYKYYKDIDIRVINIYEDEWLDSTSRPIIESIILSACNVSVNKTIEYARKLRVLEFDNSTQTLGKLREFFDTNHLQGFRSSSVYIGLVDEQDEIIECMSFGYPYFGNRSGKNNYQYELIRHCTKLYHNVVGGKERIFKYFLKNYPYDSIYDNYIISYCNIDKFSGNSYITLGFKFSSHNLQVWGLEDLHTKRVYRNPSNNDYFKTLPKIYGCGNNTYVYNI